MYCMGFMTWLQAERGYRPGQIRAMSSQKRNNLRKFYIDVYLKGLVRDGLDPQRAAEASGLPHGDDVLIRLAQ